MYAQINTGSSQPASRRAAPAGSDLMEAWTGVRGSLTCLRAHQWEQSGAGTMTVYRSLAPGFLIVMISAIPNSNSSAVAVHSMHLRMSAMLPSSTLTMQSFLPPEWTRAVCMASRSRCVTFSLRSKRRVRSDQCTWAEHLGGGQLPKSLSFGLQFTAPWALFSLCVSSYWERTIKRSLHCPQNILCFIIILLNLQHQYTLGTWESKREF